VHNCLVTHLLHIDFTANVVAQPLPGGYWQLTMAYWPGHRQTRIVGAESARNDSLFCLCFVGVTGATQRQFDACFSLLSPGSSLLHWGERSSGSAVGGVVALDNVEDKPSSMAWRTWSKVNLPACCWSRRQRRGQPGDEQAFQSLGLGVAVKA